MKMIVFDSNCPAIERVMSRQKVKNMLDRAAMTSQLADIVRQVMPERSQPVNLAADDNLYDAGLTSMAMVKLMLAVEVAFDISIPDDDLHPDNFRTIAAVEALVGRLQQI
jgi:acyl carrier protein